MKITKTHSFLNENSDLKYQRYINRFFTFIQGEYASCKNHNIKQCQQCTDSALKNA